MRKLKPSVKTAIASTLVITSTAVGVYAVDSMLDKKSTDVESETKLKLDVEKIDSDTVKVAIDNIQDIPKALQFSIRLDGNISLKDGQNSIHDLVKNIKTEEATTPSQVNSDIFTDYTYNEEENTIDVMITSNNELPKIGNKIDVFTLDIKPKDTLTRSESALTYKVLPNNPEEYKYVSNLNKEYNDLGVESEDKVISMNSVPTIETTKSFVEVVDGQTLKLTPENLGLTIKDEDEEDKDKLRLEVKDKSDNNKVITEFRKDTPGIYELECVAIDRYNERSEAITLQVNVGLDNVTTKPTITKDGQPIADMTISGGDVFKPLENVKAVDAKGRVLNVDVLVDKELELDPETDTEYNLTYTATDIYGNKAEETVKLTVLANQSPVINGVKDHHLEVGEAFDPEAGVSVNDEDNNIELNVQSNVNVNIPGTYKVIYTATDSKGKTTRAQSTVIINGKPVITALDRTINVGDTFTEKEALQGVSVFDQEDGYITTGTSVQISNVKTDTPGKYTVTYSVADSKGTTVTKDIVVTVNGLPVINATSKTINVGDKFTDEDALKLINVVDHEDGNITTKATVVENNVDINTPGEYKVVYSVEDSNKATTTKEISIRVNGLPVITTTTKTINVGDTFTDKDALKLISVLDNEDGDITTKVTVEENEVNTKEPGEYKVVYSVVDKYGAKATKEIKVRVNGLPVINATPKTINVGDKFTNEDALKLISVVDHEDKDITTKATIEKNEVNPEVAGEYAVVYSVADSDGAKVTKEIKVRVNGLPVINATSKTINVGDKFTNEDALKLISVVDHEDKDITTKATIERNEVNPEVAGEYAVVYSVVDSDGAKVTKEIKVRVNALPVINATPKTINVGDEFTDEDAMKLLINAYDQEDKDITTKVTIEKNGVNTKEAGKYPVVYSVVDNDGAKVTKEITVRVNALPVINATDKTIKVGEEFTKEDALKGIFAYDHEDKDITSKIEVIENNVKANEEGTYIVKYSVTDNDGATVTKTINVTVERNIILTESVTINNKIDKLYVNSNKVISASVSENASIKDIEWSVSDENVASIEMIGNDAKIIAKKPGEVTITAKATDGSEKSDSMTIKIAEFQQDNTIPDVIKDVIDTNILLPITGQGDTENPVEFEVKPVQTDEFSLFADNLKELDTVIESKYNEGNSTVYKLKLTQKQRLFIFSRSNDIYITLKISNDLENAKEINNVLDNIANKKPVISIISKVDKIYVGSKFDALDGVEATDKEDGDITKNIIVSGEVDTTKAGKYTIVYTVRDKNLQEVTLKRVVEVLEVPIINKAPIINATDKTIKVGEEFTNEDALKGVTAYDEEDKDITSKIKVIENTVNTDQEGTYKVKYSVTDNDGATATKTINVTVERNTILADNVTINNKIDKLYVDSNKVISASVSENASIKDIEWSVSDENVASMEMVGNNIKITAKKPGEVTITAKATDGSEKSDSITIKVINFEEDKTIPSIVKDVVDTNILLPVSSADNGENNIEFEVKPVKTDEFSSFVDKLKELDVLVESTYNEGNFTVYKLKLSQKQKVLGFNRSNDVYITLKVDDNLENAKEINNMLKNVSNQKPEISIAGLKTTITVGDTFNKLEGVSATDFEDGDITNISVIGDVNTSVPGEYELTYEVTDSAGAKTSIKVIIKVVEKTTSPDTTPNTTDSTIKPPSTPNVDSTVKLPTTSQETNNKPVITITSNTDKVYVGDSFNPLYGVKATDIEDGDITKNIIVSGNVDTSKVGKYTIVYTVKDSNSNEVTLKRVIEVVQRPNNPKTGDMGIIGLLGASGAAIGGLILNRKNKRK